MLMFWWAGTAGRSRGNCPCGESSGQQAHLNVTPKLEGAHADNPIQLALLEASATRRARQQVNTVPQWFSAQHMDTPWQRRPPQAGMTGFTAPD